RCRGRCRPAYRRDHRSSERVSRTNRARQNRSWLECRHPMTAAPPPRHFSMLRSFRLADLITLTNGFCGAGALLAFMRFLLDHDKAFFWLGTALLPIAFIMDALDGHVARKTGKGSPLGKDLDSLADIVSFGVAPAAMAFAAGMRGGWDALCLIYFVGCGISRLARFHV